MRSGVRVIVIGAGASGLAAARALHEAGAKVAVLEARERIGGRIHTDRSTFGVPVELGAQYIQGTRRRDGTLHPAWDMAQRNGWKSKPYSTDAAQAWREGREMDSDRLEKLYEEFEAADSGATDSAEAALTAFIDRRRLGPRQGAELRAVAAAMIGLEYAADLDQLSIKGADRAGSYSGGNHMLVGGYDQVPTLLAAALPDVRLGEIVTQVDRSERGCTVTTAKGVHEGDYVLCTLPLGVMKAQGVRFVPALPALRVEAIARMGMGHLDKVILEFPTRFWPKDVNWLLSLKPTAPWGVVFSDLEGVHPGHNLLVLWQSGSRALQREALGDDESVKDALGELRFALGKAIPDPLRSRVTRWGQDPFSRGAYFFPKIGSRANDVIALGTPLGNRLFFSGEATSAGFFGTVAGAILSGRREAARIIKAAS